MNTKSVKDYYAVLGVSQDATLEEIRLAYRKKAREFHPDLSADPNAEDRFREINEAYGVLADSEKRRSYDSFLVDAEDETSAQAVTGTSTGQSRPQAPSPTPPPRTSSGAGQSESTAPAAQEKTEEGKRRRVYPPTWAILLIVLGACIIFGVIVGGVLSMQRNRPGGGAESVDVTKLTTFLSPPILPTDLTVIQEDNTPLPTVDPVQLNLSGTSFPVVSVVPEQGRWPLPAEQIELGLWMHGTLINYVIGLPYAASTESLISGLTSSDRITLTLENGANLVFGSPQAKRVDVNDASPLAQDKPGLTLLLLGGDQPSRLVIQARYLPEDTRPTGEQDVDGLLVEVVNADIITDTRPPEADSWYFVVDYQIENPTGVTVDPTFFDMILEDGRGQRYVLNDAATQLGAYGRAANVINAGATVNASAGYLIPTDVRVPLVWIFKADATSGDQARFVLAFNPPPPSPAQPDVELYEVFLDNTRDVIVISGTVYNDGETPMTVTDNQVSLTAGSGASTLQASSPLLPWTIAAEGFQDFELQFSIPEGASTALINVVGFTFQVEGLNP
jgi:DnaJ-domain-containing protein 1